MTHRTAPSRIADAGLLGLRVAIGLTLFAHGAQKLSARLGGDGLDGATATMRQIGFEPAKLSAITAGGSEAAGLFLAVGLGSRATAGMGAAAMIAAAEVHRPNGFFAQKGGMEYPLVLGAACASLALTGPGRYSLDAVMDHRFDDERAGVAVLAGLQAIALGVLTSRHKRLTSAASA